MYSVHKKIELRIEAFVVSKPLTAAEKMRAKRLREKELHSKLGGKEKRIHFFNYTTQHINTIMVKAKYNVEDEAIIDALAVAAMIAKNDIDQFHQLLLKARQESNKFNQYGDDGHKLVIPTARTGVSLKSRLQQNLASKIKNS